MRLRSGLLLLLAWSGAPLRAHGDEPRIAYRIRFEAEPAPGALAVEVRVEGVRGRVAGLELSLETFGE